MISTQHLTYRVLRDTDRQLKHWEQAGNNFILANLLRRLYRDKCHVLPACKLIKIEYKESNKEELVTHGVILKLILNKLDERM